MPSIVILEKQGTVKCLNTKNISEQELHKKVGMKTDKGFKCIKRDCWTGILKKTNKPYNISIFGKDSGGRAGQENQHDLPPPLDIPTDNVKLPFFGGLVLLNYEIDISTGEKMIGSLTSDDWEAIYEQIMGGSDSTNCSDNDDDDDSEIEDLTNITLGQHGYAKDGFVVDDGECDIENKIDDESESDTKTLDDEDDDSSCSFSEGDDTEDEPEIEYEAEETINKGKPKQKQIKSSTVTVLKKTKNAPELKSTGKKTTASKKATEKDRGSLDEELEEEAYFE